MVKMDMSNRRSAKEVSLRVTCAMIELYPIAKVVFVVVGVFNEIDATSDVTSGELMATNGEVPLCDGLALDFRIPLVCVDDDVPCGLWGRSLGVTLHIHPVKLCAPS